MFIVFEGIDGTGKSTLARMLANHLRDKSRRVFLTEEPTNSWLGKAVRRGIEEEKNPFTQAFLFFADRAEHVNVIRKHLEKKEDVICDRYVYSTYAYQSAQLETRMSLSRALSWLEKLYEPIGLKPDMVFLLITAPELGLRRIGSREKKEKFEREEFLKRVQEIYLSLAEKYDFTVVDSNRSLNEVYGEIVKLIDKQLEEKEK